MARKRRCSGEAPASTVQLNVGGWLFDAARGTLERAAFFRSCLGTDLGHSYDEEGRVFLDRDGHLFPYLLSWMRTGRRPPEIVVANYKGALLEECAFFGLPDLALNLQGQSCDFDLRPEDRALRAEERAGREGGRCCEAALVDVFAANCVPRAPAELQTPLLFDKGPRLQLKGTADDFHARLAAFCGPRLVQELRGLRLPGLVVAGGAVVGALTDTPAGDIDVFLVCPQEDGVLHLRAVFAAVQRAHAEATGSPRAQLLVTRSAAAVTIYRHWGGGCSAFAPVQIVLGVSAGIADVLTAFDVDCCCVAWQPSSDRVVATRRGLRALRYGACLFDTELDSASYARRLEKYGLRGWRIGLPGLEELRVAPALLKGPHVRVRELLLTVSDGKLCTQEVRLAAHGREEKVTPSHTQQGRILQGPRRLYVMGREHLRVAEATGRLLHLGGDRALLLHGVPAEPPTDDEDEGDEGCSGTHLAAAVRLLERNGEDEGGGAMRKRAAGGTEPDHELTGPLSFVYDRAHAGMALEACACVWNAARARGIKAAEGGAFIEKYGLPRELRFEAGIARKTARTDWWDALYTA